LATWSVTGELTCRSDSPKLSWTLLRKSSDRLIRRRSRSGGRAESGKVHRHSHDVIVARECHHRPRQVRPLHWWVFVKRPSIRSGGWNDAGTRWLSSSNVSRSNRPVNRRLHKFYRKYSPPDLAVARNQYRNRAGDVRRLQGGERKRENPRCFYFGRDPFEISRDMDNSEDRVRSGRRRRLAPIDPRRNYSSGLERRRILRSFEPRASISARIESGLESSAGERELEGRKGRRGEPKATCKIHGIGGKSLLRAYGRARLLAHFVVRIGPFPIRRRRATVLVRSRTARPRKERKRRIRRERRGGEEGR